jgi:hypothetical protein
MKKLLFKLIEWTFDTTIGFTVLVLGYFAIMWIGYTIYWINIYSK